MTMPVNNSPHTNRTWLQDLTGDFYNVVIVKCSEKCREAVQANKHIEDPREWNETFDQIFNTTIDHLETVFGGVSVPRLCDVREIISTLGLVYPAMFRQSKPANVSGVLRGFAPTVKIPGLSQLAQRMIDRLRGRAKKRKQSSNAEPEENPPKRGKPKLIYGVDNKKFDGKKADADAIATIAQSKDLEDSEDMEAVFERNRAAIQHKFKNSANNIKKILKCFFSSSIHLCKHFQWLTNSKDLKIAVKENLVIQIGHIEKFLRYFDQSVQFVETLSSVETACEVEYAGCKLYKYIQILRIAGTHLDSDGAMFIRLESDGPMKTADPYIKAVEVNKKFHFELHVEKEPLLVNLDLPEAIAGYLHLAFVFNLKYPKECQTLIDIVQRLVAKYGDDSGTKTQRSKVSAQSKLENYLAGLGRVLASE